MTLGDLVLDVVASPSAAPAVGSDVPGTVRFRAGGSAANTARAVAGLGGSASFVGAVGTDPIGRRLSASLRAAGVRAHLVTVDRPTARLVVLVGPTGERSFITDRGAADQLTARQLKPRWFRADALHVPAYALLVEPLRGAAVQAAALAHEQGAAVSLDLASAAPLASIGRRRARARIAALAPGIVFGNRAEAAVVADDDASLGELAPIVVVKDGAAGCRILARDGERRRTLVVATRPVRAADTTGAGDAFAAGFLLAWLAAGSAGDPVLRRAAQAGHEAASALLRGPRPELPL